MPWNGSALLRRRLGELRPYLGADYGHVFGQRRFGIDGGDVAGWTVGMRLAGGNIGADIGYSRMFRNTAGSDLKDLFFVSTSVQW
jgi:hemolysin activation/secretion protein